MTFVGKRPITVAVFTLALVVAIATQLAVVLPGMFSMRLWEDEAFNLTVPLNLLSGLGYTSDGTLSGSELTPFDPRISTGPTVLLPIAVVLAFGADPVIGGRLVVLCFYIALLAGLCILARRIGGDGFAGKWAGLVATCVPLGWNTWRSGSPIQSPVDILGEVPAAALTVWALVIMKNRPWLAGLFVGLAMQTKLVAALSAPAIALGVLLLTHGSLRAKVSRVITCALWAVVPNVLYELWKLIALGPDGYWDNLRNFVWFFRTGGQKVGPVPPLQKLDALVSTWFSPVWLTMLTVVLFVFVSAVVLIARWPRSSGRSTLTVLPQSVSERRALAGVAMFGLVTWSVWWMLSRGTPTWPRHPSPGIYTFVPLLAAIFVASLGWLWKQQPRRSVVRPLAAFASVVLIGTLSTQLWSRLQIADESRFGEDLADQRAIAREVATLDEPWLVSAWGPEVSIVVLSGAHAGLTDVPRLHGTPQVWRNYDPSDAGMGQFDKKLRDNCRVVPVRADAYAVCEPR